MTVVIDLVLLVVGCLGESVSQIHHVFGYSYSFQEHVLEVLLILVDQSVNALLHTRHLQDAIAAGAEMGRHLEHTFDHSPEFA